MDEAFERYLDNPPIKTQDLTEIGNTGLCVLAKSRIDSKKFRVYLYQLTDGKIYPRIARKVKNKKDDLYYIYSDHTAYPVEELTPPPPKKEKEMTIDECPF